MMRYLRNPEVQSRILKDPVILTLLMFWAICVVLVFTKNMNLSWLKPSPESGSVTSHWEEGVIRVGYGTDEFDTKDLTEAIASLKPNQKIMMGDGIFTVVNTHQTSAPMHDVVIQGTGNTVLSFEGEVQAYNLSLSNVIVDAQGRNTALEAVGKSITLKNVTIRNSSNTGLLLSDDAQLTADGVTFSNVGQTCFKTSGMITAAFTNPVFTGCRTDIELGRDARLSVDHGEFRDADYGFYMTRTTPDLPICKHCTFDKVEQRVNSTGKVQFEE
jgi:hypothetical protein